MKLKFLSITALLIAVGLATPVRADEVRQTNEQQMVQKFWRSISSSSSS